MAELSLPDEVPDALFMDMPELPVLSAHASPLLGTAILTSVSTIASGSKGRAIERFSQRKSSPGSNKATDDLATIGDNPSPPSQDMAPELPTQWEDDSHQPAATAQPGSGTGSTAGGDGHSPLPGKPSAQAGSGAAQTLSPGDAGTGNGPGAGTDDQASAGTPPATQPPVYQPQLKPAALSQNSLMVFDKSVLTGSQPDSAPRFIKITAVHPTSPGTATPDGQAGLVLARGTAAEKLLTEGAIIAFEDFDKISWDATGNDGGSFSFVPLDERQQPITDVAPQTIQVVEHPAPPRYPNPATAHPQPVADGQDLALSALSFAGLDRDKAPTAVRIIAIELEDGAAGAPSPLVIVRPDGSGQVLSEGSTLTAADFGHVQWRTAGNAGGQFLFQPLAADGEPLAGSQPQRIAIHKHPAPPVYEATDTDQSVAHDQHKGFAESLFSGTDSTRKPAGILITAVNPKDPAAADAPALTLEGHADPVTEGWFIRAEDFGKLSWSTALNNGGSFSFVPANADRTPILGAETRTVNVHESPLAPVYADQVPNIGVAHDGLAALDATLFAGTAPSQQPAFIRIEAIEPNTPTGGVAGAAPSLTLGADPAVSPITVGQEIAASQFDQLHWHATHNTGGSFRFVALDAHKRPILKPDGHPVTQTISIEESAAAPDYAANIDRAVAHDQILSLEAALFEGDDPQRKPVSVRIEAIQETGDTNTGESALYLDEGGQITRLKVGDTITQAQFSMVRWDRAQNEGGSFRFVPLDDQGRDIVGATARTVNVHESPVAPDYSDTPSPAVAHDQVLTLAASIFEGRNVLHKPAAVRITAIQETGDTHTGESALYLHDGAQITRLKVGDTITQAQFANVRWDSAQNQGGSFQFTPLDAQGRDIVGATDRTISLHESPRAPVYPAQAPNVLVQHDSTQALDAALF